MPTPTKQTAMQILRDRLQRELPLFKKGSIGENIYSDIIYLINTEMMEIEKQQRKDDVINAHIAGQKFASDNDNPDSEEYYLKTYNPK